jgi:hypothetical protein
MAKNGKRTASPASVFVDTDGKHITSDADIAKAYRQWAVTEEQNPLENLDDEQVAAIVKAIPGDESNEDTGVEVHDERIAALVERNEEKTDLQDLTSPPSAMTPFALKAERIGAEIGKVADPMLEEVADAKEVQVGRPLALAIQLMREMKDWNAEFTKSGYPIRCPFVLTLPIPGSSYRDKEGLWGNNPTDVYEERDTISDTKRVTRFYRTMADAMPAGIRLQSDIRDLQLMKDAPESVKNKKLLELYGSDAQGRKSKLAQLMARRTARQATLARAIAYIQTITRLNDDFDTETVGWNFVEPISELEEICRRNRPLKLVAKGEMTSTTDPFSLSQFISLQHPGPKGIIRFVEAKMPPMSGTTADLNTVIKARKPNEDGQQGGNKNALGEKQGIPTPEGLDAFARMLNTEFDPNDKLRWNTYLGRFRSYLNRQTAETDETLIQIEEMRMRLEDILEPYKASGRISKIYEQQAKRSGSRAA